MANRQNLHERAFKLAAFVFRLYPKLATAGVGHAFIAKQLLRAASSIGSNLEEGAAPSSRRDMTAKYAIALREARESKFWARLLATDARWSKELAWVIQESGEFVAMLTVSVKKLRKPKGEDTGVDEM
jgi:four helix bundle protein